MKKIFTILLLITCLTSVKAYENDFFTLEVPEGYTEEINNNIYKWSKDNKYISITVGNNENEYDVAEYTDQDLEKQKNYLEQMYKNSLLDYNMTVEISDMKKDTINDYSILTYESYWPSKDSVGHDIYQKSAVYTTKHYIYTILVSDEEKITDENFKEVLNTFELKDDKITHTKGIITIILVLGTFLGVLGFIIEHKKKRA